MPEVSEMATGIQRAGLQGEGRLTENGGCFVWSVGCFVWSRDKEAQPKSGTLSAFQSSIMMSGILPIIAYLIGVPAIMIGSILFVGAIIGLTIGRADETPPAKAPQKKNSSVQVMPGFLRPWR